LVALLCFLDEEPLIGRLLTVEPLGGGAGTLARRDEVIAKITIAIERGGEGGGAGARVPSLTGEGIVGGVLSVLHTRLTKKSAGRFSELTNPLMCMIVLPYLGAAAARGELKRSVPSPTVPLRDSVALVDSFKEAGIRLTYRTVRVLMAVGEHPGASNRLVAEAAQISDQGQSSKLLRRLERAGMLTNTGLGPGLGAPNAWTLTASGRQVISTIGAHTEAPGPGVLSSES